MDEASKVCSNLQKTTNFLSNAIQLAVSTAIQLVDLSGTENEDKNLENKSMRISNLAELPEISLNQVSWHDQYDDCWIILYDRVYDITEFLQEHPGGADVLLEYAGRDGTLAFRGFGHSAQAWQILQKYLIGILPQNERSRMFKEEEKLVGMNLRLRAAS